MFFGVLLILILLFRPKGLVSFLARWMPIFRERLYRE
jgi:ABC-type branched-subunit amino acid transport system permease subunit